MDFSIQAAVTPVQVIQACDLRPKQGEQNGSRLPAAASEVKCE